jgi:uncharacterized membrane protein YphA (DoxX/SURF4 family)
MIDAVDKFYCKALGIFNPYHAMPNRLDMTFPRYDGPAYKKNPRYNFVYDKLFIAQSQGLASGPLSELQPKNTTIKYPIFIKPRYGHKTASSKYCYKIKDREALEKHFDKPDMMWSEFVNATEGMTDFALVDGEIKYQLSYIYSDQQYGFADVWKKIDPDTEAPPEIVAWVRKYLTTYTGPVNVQYRSTSIIEVGLRFARSGMYIESCGNKALVDDLNEMWRTKAWPYRRPEEYKFKPFYSFKCWSPIPILYLIPQHLLDFVMHNNGSMPFYEYYFEPTGVSSAVFFQFLHHDFDQGMQLKKTVERTSLTMNVLIGLLVLLGVVYTFFTGCARILLIAIILYITSFDNSLVVLINQFKNSSLKHFVGGNRFFYNRSCKRGTAYF